MFRAGKVAIAGSEKLFKAGDDRALCKQMAREGEALIAASTAFTYQQNGIIDNARVKSIYDPGPSPSEHPDAWRVRYNLKGQITGQGPPLPTSADAALAPSASPCAATEEQVDLDLGVMTGVPRNPSTCPDLESAARRLSQLTEEMNEDKSSSEASSDNREYAALTRLLGTSSDSQPYHQASGHWMQFDSLGQENPDYFQ